MAKLPEVVSKAWEEREAVALLTTVDADGMPIAIYVLYVKKYDEERIVVADNYFNKTRANISNGSKGAFLFITKEKKSYQINGRIDYLTSGAIYDDMKKWVDPKHPAVAATVVNVEEVYCGGEKLL